MGCCPPVPPSSVLGAANLDRGDTESDIRRGETVECYMARNGNSTGMHDDATENVDNKIENCSIPIIRSTTSASVDVTFKLTDGSTRTASSWSVTPMPPGLSLSAAHLSGTFSTVNEVYKVEVLAADADGTIDARTFTLAPSVGGSNDEIRLISPLPGAIVNSKFGPRMHPIKKVMKAHTGIDMKFADRSVADVVAAADGEVIRCAGSASSKVGYGLLVHIKHSSGSGKHICTTTYNHLAKCYVSEGQKVMAGQKIGLEGTSGGSTGNHLHFECKLPDGKFVDPEPLINGSLVVAGKTLPNGEADPTSVTTKTSSASLSTKEAEARQSSCEAFGPTYPAADPAETTDPVPVPVPGTSDPYELGWFFIMKHEVGPHWTESSPSDPEIAQGLCQTKEQKKKCGFVQLRGDTGGVTKFGISQNNNPRTIVKEIGYEEAKQIGFNNYWKSSKMPCQDKAARVAIMLFDMNFLFGVNGSHSIWEDAGVTSSVSDDVPTQIATCEALHAARVRRIKASRKVHFHMGWLKRADECLAYVKSLP